MFSPNGGVSVLVCELFIFIFCLIIYPCPIAYCMYGLANAVFLIFSKLFNGRN